MSIIGAINQTLAVFGIQIHSTRSPFWNTAIFERHILYKVSKHTMTSDARILALMRGIDHVVRNEIAGDIVECDVWRGGSMMTAAMTLLRHGVEPTLWLYDTYEGMPPPTDVDVDPSGKTVAELLSVAAPDDLVRPYASLDQVKSGMALTRYPNNRLRFVVGKVEDTQQHTIPERIALLRLDTDWYESTKVELEVLWDRLERGGILILHDYGHWVGAKKAVDEYFGDIFMDRIDNSGRLIIKQ